MAAPSPLTVSSLPEEDRYRLLVEAVTDYAIYMLDADGTVTSWNPGAQRFKGYRADEIIGQHFSRFYAPEDRHAGLPERALAIAAERGQFEGEGWRLRKDGTRFWALVVIDPIRSADGRVIGYAKVTRDLTERRETEAALRRTQEQFRLLVQGVTDYAIYMLDLQGRVVSWNAGAEHIKGYQADEIVGRNFSTFYRAEDRALGTPERALATVLQRGRFESEGWRVRKDGSQFWASVVMDQVHDDDGKIIGIAKVTRDVTEKRQAQQALEAAQASLFQSQKLDAIGQLTGGVAHDFNNLLMVILSSLRLIDRRGGEADPLLRKWVMTATRAAQRGAALTQRMLAFARRQEPSPERVDLGALVRGMSDLLQRSVGPTLTLTLDTPEDLPPAFVDPNQLELALLNLVVNARDAMPTGGPVRIELAARQVDASEGSLPAGSYLSLAVIDTGEGMDDETLQRAMEPFFTTKGIGRGTGLGLSMVHGLAAQSGGRFLLTSQPGQGTRAEVWLPAARAAADSAAAEPRTASGTPAIDAALDPRQPLRVLLVDDDALVLESTAALLQDLGHQPSCASDAPDALRLLREDPAAFDLVMTDQAMPRLSGAELLAEVQRLRPGLAAIVASGYVGHTPGTLPEHAVRLDKPFDQEQLIEAIRTALERGGGR
ncbi:PAS domain S-box protein [Paucibacter sp. R3-3]|uniref:histidine kinase n=1 Tax=Roseateles agri TaxID=3098619 RepID=A0ABU5DAY1_9BURK|nr:PAS domain S-box protein [Paucibacter sp. R3-3]MDY0743436.1 PAS domain S-box protein [Paucibacter sp. R3-3]